MGAWGLLTSREVQELWRRKAYWVTTALLVALVSGAFIVLPLLRHHHTTLKWSVTAPTPAQTQVIQQALDTAATGSFAIQWVRPAQAAVTIRISATPAFGDRILVHVHQNPAPSQTWIRQALGAAIIGQRLEQLPNSTQVQAALQAPSIRVQRAPHVAPAPPTAEVAVTMSLIMVVFLTLSIYGQMTMQSVAAEKASRLSELMSVRVSPATLLIGKWAGVGLAAAIQIAIAVLVGLGFMTFDPQASVLINSWHLHAAPMWLWVATAIGFVGGYGFFGTLFLALGASLARPEDARASMGLPSIALLAAYGSMLYAMAHTTSLLTHVLTMLPPFFPFLIILAQGMGTATAMEWIVGILATGLSVVLLMRWASRLYRRTLYHEVPRRGRSSRRLVLRR